MKKVIIACLVLTIFFISINLTNAQAETGDLLIGVGPTSRAMGGVGIASPQDTISANYSNPAAMCFGASCIQSEFDFGATLLMPYPDTKITIGNNTISSGGDKKIYTLPAIGLSVPLSSNPTLWRFGFAAFCVSGFGVDYRDTDLDNSKYYDLSPLYGQPSGTVTAPLAGGTFTHLQIMKFAPSISFQAIDKLSLGLALHIDYGMLDLQNGVSSNYGIGGQLGLLYKINQYLSFGATYIAPNSITYKNVIDLDSNGKDDDLKIESPQQIGIGLAITPMKDKLLLEADLKWINWENAEGYSDFGFDNQVVVALGIQYKPTDNLSLRLGYNYGKNPVKEHNGFSGSATTNVQGKSMPTYYYETFRIVGMPTITEHHLSGGIGYEFSKRFKCNVGYVHGFKNTVKENGTDIMGNSAILESSVSGDSIEFGLTWLF
jgi:long-chain fatty acid transport protein